MDTPSNPTQAAADNPNSSGPMLSQFSASYQGLGAVATVDLGYAGLDFCEPDRFSALSIIRQDEGKLLVVAFAWIPETLIEDMDSATDGLASKLISAGSLIPFSAGDDPELQVANLVLKLLNEKEFPISSLGCDISMTRTGASRLREAGVNLQDIPQGYNLSPALKLIQEYAQERRLEHGSCELLSWSVPNSNQVEKADGAIALSRPPKSEVAHRVEPAIAMATAVACLLGDKP